MPLTIPSSWLVKSILLPGTNSVLAPYQKLPVKGSLSPHSKMHTFFLLRDNSLATVAQKVLGRTKLIEKSGREKVAEITRLFQTDKTNLAQYNLEDAKLVYEIAGCKDHNELPLRCSWNTRLPVL